MLPLYATSGPPPDLDFVFDLTGREEDIGAQGVVLVPATAGGKGRRRRRFIAAGGPPQARMCAVPAAADSTRKPSMTATK
jgi:hypothetical protein